jgi:two-component system, repressor protein LuxO
MSQPKPTILLIEDTTSLVQVYLQYLRNESAEVVAVETLASARELILKQPPAAILLDLNLPDGSGMELLHEIRAKHLDTAVIVISAHGSIAAAVEAMRAGADDFLVKPFASERLRTTLHHVFERRRLARIVETLAPVLNDNGFEGFVGSSLPMQAVYTIIERAARSRAAVFITGESGAGKEVAAEAIHRRSTRRDAPFIALNCGAIAKELIESEIFGHVRGAFTGAIQARVGAASRADGGTLFLDEICEMDAALQVKLLRFVQSGVVQKVGGDVAEKVDVRIICATNRNPLAEVEAGRFREDLYYRLHVIPVELPPLRERDRDVLLIARHFLAEFNCEEGKSFSGFAPDVEELFLAYSWPGNVRQLQNVIRNVTVLYDGPVVTQAMLPREIRPAEMQPSTAAKSGGSAAYDVAPAGRETIRPLAEVERATIERAIHACDGNLTEAAACLGINVSTIHRKRQAWLAAAGEPLPTSRPAKFF